MSRRTQSRVVPYLKVAAPAALVAAPPPPAGPAPAPPAQGPSKVGAGGYQAPAPRSASCRTASGTPGSTVTSPAPSVTMRSIRSVATTTSPTGVAPPVSEDWAPIGSRRGDARTTAATSASERGCTTPDA